MYDLQMWESEVGVVQHILETHDTNNSMYISVSLSSKLAQLP